MTRIEKVLWEDIIKLLSFKSTENFIEELAIENVYDEDICNISREIINPKNLKHSETDTFDVWNTHLDSVLPGAFLDKVEDNFDEDKACDIEDYYFYLRKRMVFGIIFNYWWTVFTDYVEKNPDGIIVNPIIHEKINNYLNYCFGVSSDIEQFEITDEWDLYINSLYLPEIDEDEDEEIDISYNYIKEQINKFTFVDISYDFWSGLNELSEEELMEIKQWAIDNYGEESNPLIPQISEEETELEDEE